MEGSNAQGHVSQQPLLRAAAVAVSQGGDHLVLLRRHVQTLVAVHMQQGEPLGDRQTETQVITQMFNYDSPPNQQKHIEVQLVFTFSLNFPPLVVLTVFQLLSRRSWIHHS